MVDVVVAPSIDAFTSLTRGGRRQGDRDGSDAMARHGQDRPRPVVEPGRTERREACLIQWCRKELAERAWCASISRRRPLSWAPFPGGSARAERTETMATTTLRSGAHHPGRDLAWSEFRPGVAVQGALGGCGDEAARADDALSAGRPAAPAPARRRRADLRHRGRGLRRVRDGHRGERGLPPTAASTVSVRIGATVLAILTGDIELVSRAAGPPPGFRAEHLPWVDTRPRPPKALLEESRPSAGRSCALRARRDAPAPPAR